MFTCLIQAGQPVREKSALDLTRQRGMVAMAYLLSLWMQMAQQSRSVTMKANECSNRRHEVALGRLRVGAFLQAPTVTSRPRSQVGKYPTQLVSLILRS
mmetsp:Transcript_55203/g.118505  ORF Transcript_55203/g.118505 Transcript_55203/m.118505 type:complete len:99 (-) Transcript_55203:968-1264(-)